FVVVAERLTVVPCPPTFAQSTPASPVALTSRVLPPVVGSRAFVEVPERFCAVVGLPIFAQSSPASPPADKSRSRPAVVGASGTFVTASAWKYSTFAGGKKLILSMAAAVKDTPAVSVTVLVDPVYADTTPN